MPSQNGPNPSINIFPLESTSQKNVEKLCEALFGWKDCTQCANGGVCSLATCSWRRLPILEPYLQFYRTNTSWSIPEELYSNSCALATHEDLLDIIRLVKRHPDTSYKTLVSMHMLKNGGRLLNGSDQRRAFNLAVKVMTMVSCAVGCSDLVPWKPGHTPIVWKDDESIRTLMVSTFPVRDPVSFHDDFGCSIRTRLSGTRLSMIYGIRFRPTDDLRRHLLLDAEKRVVEIYHHTGFLKEHLLRTRDAVDDSE